MAAPPVAVQIVWSITLLASKQSRLTIHPRGAAEPIGPDQEKVQGTGKSDF